MNKILITLLCMLLLCGCSKGVEQPSDEVRITVLNECFCHIKIYQDSRLVLADDYDCEYLKVLPIKVARGAYRIVADNGLGKEIDMAFEKGFGLEELLIEF